MKICPKCGREFGNSSIRCPICKVDLELMREARRTTVNAGTGRTSAYYKEAATTEAIEQQRVAPSKKEPEIPSGPSALSIIALIFSLIGCLGFIGAILAIVDLCIKDGKKKVCSVLALVFCGIWLSIIGIVSFASKDSEKEVNRRVETNNTEADGNINGKEYEELDNNINIQKNNDMDTRQEAAENEMNVDVLAEYTISDGIGWYTRRFMIIKNNSNETVDVSTSSLAYSSDGTMVGADDSELKPGETISKQITSYEEFDSMQFYLTGRR
ncbi:hypothetical protein D7X98_11350 [bacterium 1XD8-76]|nr:hypothetical protein D7X98_11350 [bacterium 1XD8-76]